jgi:hypothetical protein
VRDVTKQRYKVVDSQRGLLGLCYILESDLSFPANDVVGYKVSIHSTNFHFGQKVFGR